MGRGEWIFGLSCVSRAVQVCRLSCGGLLFVGRATQVCRLSCVGYHVCGGPSCLWRTASVQAVMCVEYCCVDGWRLCKCAGCQVCGGRRVWKAAQVCRLVCIGLHKCEDSCVLKALVCVSGCASLQAVVCVEVHHMCGGLLKR